MNKEEIREEIREENLVENWEVEEITSKELEMLSEELLAGCGIFCGGHGRKRDL